MSETRPYQSQWDIVAHQFKKRRSAVWGLRVATFLLMLAIYAPVLASSQPLLWRVPGGGMESPWLAGLFDVNIWEHALDRLFNLVMVTLTIYLAARGVVAIVARRTRVPDSLVKWMRRGFIVVTALVALCQLSGGLLASQPSTDYRQTEARARLALEGASAEQIQAFEDAFICIRTPIPYGYREQLPTLEDRFRGFGDFARGEVHLCGTDEIGRDVFARILYGTRISLTIGIVAVGIYVTIGTILGAIAGYLGGRTDLLIMRLVEIFICIPGLFLILTIVALFREQSIFLIMGAIGLVRWTGITRLVRGEFMRERNIDYVNAAKAMGFGTPRIVFRHILPNAMAPVLVASTFGIAAAILVESGLSFLGLGDVTVPSWGRVLNDGRIHEYWHLIVPPSVAIFVTVTALNLVGDGLRDALDPKLRD